MYTNLLAKIKKLEQKVAKLTDDTERAVLSDSYKVHFSTEKYTFPGLGFYYTQSIFNQYQFYQELTEQQGYRLPTPEELGNLIGAKGIKVLKTSFVKKGNNPGWSSFSLAGNNDFNFNMVGSGKIDENGNYQGLAETTSFWTKVNNNLFIFNISSSGWSAESVLESSPVKLAASVRLVRELRSEEHNLNEGALVNDSINFVGQNFPIRLVKLNDLMWSSDNLSVPIGVQISVETHKSTTIYQDPLTIIDYTHSFPQEYSSLLNKVLETKRDRQKKDNIIWTKVSDGIYEVTKRNGKIWEEVTINTSPIIFDNQFLIQLNPVTAQFTATKLVFFLTQTYSGVTTVKTPNLFPSYIDLEIIEHTKIKTGKTKPKVYGNSYYYDGAEGIGLSNL